MLVARMRLREVREARGYSAEQLADEAQLHPATVRALEDGAAEGVTFWIIARLAETLLCTPGDLIVTEAVDDAVPVFGGPDEDEIIRRRLADTSVTIDGPALVRDLLGAAAVDRAARS